MLLLSLDEIKNKTTDVIIISKTANNSVIKINRALNPDNSEELYNSSLHWNSGARTYQTDDKTLEITNETLMSDLKSIDPSKEWKIGVKGNVKGVYPKGGRATSKPRQVFLSDDEKLDPNDGIALYLLIPSNLIEIVKRAIIVEEKREKLKVDIKNSNLNLNQKQLDVLFKKQLDGNLEIQHSFKNKSFEGVLSFFIDAYNILGLGKNKN
jgi:hypothetical protein